MIKFFRKIRQTLLYENKLSKYLVYAFGEIVLVVIGILIALSVNNWNNEKKDRAKEYAIVKNLIGDLKKDKLDLKSFMMDVRELEKSLETLLNFYDRDLSKSINVDSLHLLYKRAIRLKTWPQNDRTLSQLESTGEYILLQPNVADSISKYKKLVASFKRQEGGVYRTFRENIDAAAKYLHLHLVQFGYFEYINQAGELTGKPLPPISLSFDQKTEFFNRASQYSGSMLQLYYAEGLPLEDYIDKLIVFLEEYYSLE